MTFLKLRAISVCFVVSENNLNINQFMFKKKTSSEESQNVFPRTKQNNFSFSSLKQTICLYYKHNARARARADVQKFILNKLIFLYLGTLIQEFNGVRFADAGCSSCHQGNSPFHFHLFLDLGLPFIASHVKFKNLFNATSKYQSSVIHILS